MRCVAAPCCGAKYSLPSYSSINFSAQEYWSDGWREGSLFPNDEGLRKCNCGRYILLDELTELIDTSGHDIPQPAVVTDEQLDTCLDSMLSDQVEIAARLTLWRVLNHPYRLRYRQHRSDEDDRLRVDWESSRQRRWMDYFRRRSADAMPKHAERTLPEFVCTQEQFINMKRLCVLLGEKRSPLDVGNILQLAELHRQLGHFGQVAILLDGCRAVSGNEHGALLRALAEAKVNAPVCVSTSA